MDKSEDRMIESLLNLISWVTNYFTHNEMAEEDREEFKALLEDSAARTLQHTISVLKGIESREN